MSLKSNLGAGLLFAGLAGGFVGLYQGCNQFMDYAAVVRESLPYDEKKKEEMLEANAGSLHKMALYVGIAALAFGAAAKGNNMRGSL